LKEQFESDICPEIRAEIRRFYEKLEAVCKKCGGADRRSENSLI
jgi:hypothetical protein